MLRKDCEFYQANGSKCEILIKMTCREKSTCNFYKRRECSRNKSVEDLFRQEEHAAYMRIACGAEDNGDEL